MPGNKDRLRIIPLGGFGEIGKNMMAVQYGEDILVIDAGLAFPEEEMLGIDIVIPDYTYLTENRERVRAIVLTHGHEDHVGALPYLLRSLEVPVYGTALTMGLVRTKLEEYNVELHPDSRVVRPRDCISAGVFQVEFFRVNHSIADSVGLAIRNPVGTVVHTGDFKLDQTPVDGLVTDYHKLAELGDQGVLVLLSDSTNAERPGYTLSEKAVGQTLEDIFRTSRQRILVASFASNVHRIQQVINAAYRFNRKVAVVGRSMEKTVEVAVEEGYLWFPEGLRRDLDEINRLPAEQVAILTTGSQGEPLSALTRMAMADHKKVEIMPGDVVIIAATPVPGNEKLVHRTIDNLFRRGAEVIYETISGVHVSGHASQEELKIMLNLTRPRFFVPIHGEYRHLVHHARLAESMGVPRQNILVGENGTIFEFTREEARLGGRVTAGTVLVDGLGVGDVGQVVLRDRKQLAQDGILIVVMAINKESGLMVAGPEIISRGFVYVRESEALLEEARERVKVSLETLEDGKITEWGAVKGLVRDTLGKHLYEKTHRRPMILPIIVEV